MDDSNKQLCQLCLDKTPASECEPIEEINKTMLEFLLININFDITDCAVACNMCQERLQESFDFKSRCSTTFVEADIKADDVKFFPSEIMSNDGSIGNTSLRSFQVCRLCMSAPSDEWDSNYIINLKGGVPLQEVITYCFPDKYLNDVNEPPICKPCLNSLNRFYEFMKICREAERLGHLVTPATADIPILEDILKSKAFEELGKSIIIKKECSDAENYVNLVTCPKNEDISSIKCEECDIKDEADTGQEMDDSVPLGSCNNSMKSGSLKRKRQIRKSASKGRKNFSSKDRMARHRGLTKAFGCLECTFKTDRKYILARHMIRHKDRSQMDTCNHALSPYKIKDEREMLNHQLSHKKSVTQENSCHTRTTIKRMLKHRNPNAERKFKCDKCSYDTNFMCHMRKHNLKHKNKLEVEMHKCENCEYETRYKSNMSIHMVKHRDPKAERKFKCDKCPYETDFKGHLNRHNLTHLNIHYLTHKVKSEVEMHKCANCEFETGYKRNMIRHMVKHRDPKAERKFKCDKCSYESDFKGRLNTHNLTHKDKSEVEMHKCENCEFESKYKKSMIRHMGKHRILAS